MTQLGVDERRIASDPSEADIQALIKEARRRTRRRRARWVAAIVVVVGVGAAVAGLIGGGVSRSARGSITPTARFVNIHAFTGDGELAFVSRGKAWVLDGARGTLRRLPVPRGERPSSPVFSHDGRWLAYVTTRRRNASGPLELWIARSDGTASRHVSDLAVNQFFGWSPRTDLVAVAAGESQHPPEGFGTALDVISPQRRVRSLFAPSSRVGAIWSGAWSPNGRSIAVSTYSVARDSGTQILDVPVTGARPAVWLSIRNSRRLTGALGCGSLCGGDYAIVDLAGWWPKWGIAFWIYSSGMTHNSDATPLAVIREPHGRLRVIARTLSDGTTDAVAADDRGELALVASSTSTGRDYAAGKTVQRCSPASFSCTAVPEASTWDGAPLACRPCFGAPATGPGSAVTLDPAWSPDGRLLAYVKAPAYRGSGNPSLAWFQAHQLEVWNPHTNHTRPIGTIRGASLPTWSRNGKSLLYVSQDGL